MPPMGVTLYTGTPAGEAAGQGVGKNTATSNINARPREAFCGIWQAHPLLLKMVIRAVEDT